MERDAPEEVEETKCLEDKADKWPFDKYQYDTAKKTHRSAQLVLSRKEVKRLLWPNNKKQSTQEEDLRLLEV